MKTKYGKATSSAKLGQKDFGLMSSEELAQYAGPVYTARLKLWSYAGYEILIDIEAPTEALWEAHVTLARRGRQLLARHDYHRMRTPNGP